jgi:hypothetical protein
MLIPEEARNRIRESEALFHFSLNLFIVGIASLTLYVEYMAYSISQNGFSVSSFPWFVIAIASALAAWFGWWLLPGAAHLRGEQVKSIFDLYRGKLAEGLGLELPETEQAEREMWELVSRRMMFRIPYDAKSLDQFRKKASTLANAEASQETKTNSADQQSKKTGEKNSLEGRSEAAG